MGGQKPGYTLQATALVNEAYVRLIDCAQVNGKDRAHFFATASQAGFGAACLPNNGSSDSHSVWTIGVPSTENHIAAIFGFAPKRARKGKRGAGPGIFLRIYLPAY